MGVFRVTFDNQKHMFVLAESFEEVRNTISFAEKENGIRAVEVQEIRLREPIGLFVNDPGVLNLKCDVVSTIKIIGEERPSNRILH